MEVQPYGSPTRQVCLRYETSLYYRRDASIFNSWKEQLAHFNSNFPETNMSYIKRIIIYPDIDTRNN